MTDYNLTLTWTAAAGAGGGGQAAVRSRRNKAIRVAHRNSVAIVSIAPTASGATWLVDGAPDDVRNMISEWTGHGKVTVSGGPLGP